MRPGPGRPANRFRPGNPYDEPCEFAFAYHGTPSLHKSGYVDHKDDIPIETVPVAGTMKLDHVVDNSPLHEEGRET